MCLAGVPGLSGNEFMSAASEAKPQGKGKLGSVCRKTKLCKFYALGKCSKGGSCNFAHDPAELKALPDLTCTKACPALATTGRCDDPRCHFAHGREELRRVFLPSPPEALQPRPDRGEPRSAGTSETCSLSREPDDERSSSPDSSPLSIARRQPPSSGRSAAGALAAAASVELQLGFPPAGADGATHPARAGRLRKTKMCAYQKLGYCLKGEACNFAHSPEEQQPPLRRTRSDERQSTSPQPKLTRARSEEGPWSAQSTSDELRRALAHESSSPSTPSGHVAPAPPTPASDDVLVLMPVCNGAPALLAPVPEAILTASMTVQVVVAAPAPVPVRPLAPTPLLACAVHNQPCVDASQLPEFPSSPWADTPLGAAACSDPFCTASVALNERGVLGLPLRPMTRIPSESSQWEPNEWSDSEIGDF